MDCRRSYLTYRCSPLIGIAAVALLAVSYSGCTFDRSAEPNPVAEGAGGGIGGSSEGGMSGAGGSTSQGGGGAGGMGGSGAGGMGGMPPVDQIPTINCGQFHTCTARDDFTAECWGLGDDGQLGQGANANSNVPVSVDLGALQARDIQGGFYHSCVLLLDGTVQCVGQNTAGQLGNGTTSDSNAFVTVANVTAKALAVGDRHSCAITAPNGTVMCWGDNSQLQLGGSTAPDTISTTPIPVVGLPAIPAVQITAGKEHTCALMSNGDAYCWGYSNHAQLGSNIVDANTAGYPPLLVPLLNITQIDAGTSTTCAVNNTNEAYCWGSNSKGEAGVGSTTANITAPTLVNGSLSVRSISTGWDHTCAVLMNDQVWCWGDNAAGEVGNTVGGIITNPVQVMTITNADIVSTGVSHSCAALQDMSIRCWGENSFGQLGNGTTTSNAVPVTPVGY